MGRASSWGARCRRLGPSATRTAPPRARRDYWCPRVQYRGCMEGAHVRPAPARRLTCPPEGTPAVAAGWRVGWRTGLAGLPTAATGRDASSAHRADTDPCRDATSAHAEEDGFGGGAIADGSPRPAADRAAA